MMSARRTHEQFLAEMQVKNPGIRVLGRYSTANEPVLVECKQCGRQWMGRPANLLGSKNKAPSGCARCANNLKGNTEDFVREMEALHPTITVLGEYHGNKAPIKVQCNVCGSTWSPTPNSLRNGHGCGACFHTRNGLQSRKTEEEFIEQLLTVNPDIELVGHYEKATNKVHVKCGLCGHTWDVIPGNLLNGSGCPNCNASATSFMEQMISEVFKRAVGEDKVLCRDSSAIGMELDIYIPELHFAVEPGSWRAWHKDKVERDRLKREKCTQAGIKLVTVYDNCPDSECPFEENCYSFPIDLATQKDHLELKRLVAKLLNDAGIEHCFSNEEWKEIDVHARRKSRRRGHEWFVESIRDRNPNIEVLGKYQDRHARVRVRDVRCGHEFMGDPASLLSGRGCPKCRYIRSARSNSLSNEEFLRRVAAKKLPILPLSECVGANKPVKVKCLECGYEWSPTPHNLFSRHGCPRCNGCERYSTESFREVISRINPTVEVVGEYKNNKTPIECRCKECGTSWFVAPKTLKKGSGCPKCARRKRAEKQKLDHGEYVRRLSEKNPNLELLTQYESLDKRVTARCLLCGQEFQISAGELLHRVYKRHLHT